MSRSYEREEQKARERMIDTILAEDKVGHLTRTFLEKRSMDSLIRISKLVKIFEKKGVNK